MNEEEFFQALKKLQISTSCRECGADDSDLFIIKQKGAEVGAVFWLASEQDASKGVELYGLTCSRCGHTRFFDSRKIQGVLKGTNYE